MHIFNKKKNNNNKFVTYSTAYMRKRSKIVTCPIQNSHIKELQPEYWFYAVKAICAMNIGMMLSIQDVFFQYSWDLVFQMEKVYECLPLIVWPQLWSLKELNWLLYIFVDMTLGEFHPWVNIYNTSIESWGFIRRPQKLTKSSSWLDLST